MTVVRIESIAAGGDGVGRTGGMVAFIPRTAPGDLVEARLTGRKRFARGVIEAVVEPSADRVEPLCEHYVRDQCGGCQIQHLGYPAQLVAKSGIIRDGITRIGKRSAELPAVVPSPIEWRYRAKLTLAMRNLPGGWRIGLHPWDDPTAVFQLNDCPITDERVVNVWRAIFANTRLLPLRADRGSVRVHDDDSATVVIEGGDEWGGAPELMNAVPEIAALWWKPSNEKRRLVATRAADNAGASFAQVNPRMAAVLRAHVLERVRAHQPRTLVDAYSGTGATAIPLSREGMTVTAIELDAAASETCAAGLEPPSRALSGRVEALLTAALPADVVIVNPPRTGLADEVPAQLQFASPLPRAVIYVSCNPATLGRDLQRMPGYRVASVRGFDMFPQTAHVETVCELVPEAA